MTEFKEIEFEKLRIAYEVVKKFLEEKTFTNVDSLSSSIENDLDLYGDDNVEILDEFCKRFELNYENFEYEKYFHTERELYGSEALLSKLLDLSIWLPLKTIELICLNKISFEKPKILESTLRETKHLTFKDLIVWYIEGKFNTSEQIKYVIKK